MVDLHLHLLPAIDDGPGDTEASLRMARALLADGIERVAVSPHVSESYPNSADRIAESVQALRAAFDAAGINLPVATGAEIALDRISTLSDQELVALSVAGRGRHLLIEMPRFAWPMDIELHVARAASLGLQVVLAHPECCTALQEDSTPLGRLVERGALGQVSASSLLGATGGPAMRAAQEMIDRGMIQIVSSDSHGAERRPPRMREAFAALGGGAVAEWMTVAVPSALLAAQEPPPRPAGGTRPTRRTLFRRRGRG